jgi:hypothetical protein
LQRLKVGRACILGKRNVIFLTTTRWSSTWAWGRGCSLQNTRYTVTMTRLSSNGRLISSARGDSARFSHALLCSYTRSIYVLHTCLRASASRKRNAVEDMLDRLLNICVIHQLPRTTISTPVSYMPSKLTPLETAILVSRTDGRSPRLRRSPSHRILHLRLKLVRTLGGSMLEAIKRDAFLPGQCFARQLRKPTPHFRLRA